MLIVECNKCGWSGKIEDLVCNGDQESTSDCSVCRKCGGEMFAVYGRDAVNNQAATRDGDNGEVSFEDYHAWYDDQDPRLDGESK